MMTGSFYLRRRSASITTWRSASPSGILPLSIVVFLYLIASTISAVQAKRAESSPSFELHRNFHQRPLHGPGSITNSTTSTIGAAMSGRRFFQSKRRKSSWRNNRPYEASAGQEGYVSDGCGKTIVTRDRSLRVVVTDT